MIGILRPVAAFLPYQTALAIARSIGTVRTVIPFYGRVKALQVRRAFRGNRNAKDATRLAAEYLARPLSDCIVLRRFRLHGWADFDRWHVEQRSTAAVDALRASDESFILATGHFSRQACMPLYRRDIVSQKITSILRPYIKRTINPHTWWLGYHYGQMLDCLRAAHPEMQFVHPGQIGAHRRVLETLAGQHNVVLVYADAQMARRNGCYVRSFAGLKEQSFATGAARLSRITGRPIAVCIPYLVDDQTIILEWTRVIRSPGDDDRSDTVVTDLILDDIEKAIGRRPGQYLQECFGERRWDARAEQWVSS